MLDVNSSFIFGHKLKITDRETDEIMGGLQKDKKILFSNTDNDNLENSQNTNNTSIDNSAVNMEQQISSLKQDNSYTIVQNTTNTTPHTTRTLNPHNIQPNVLETFRWPSKTKITKLKCTLNNLERHQQAQTLPSGLQLIHVQIQTFHGKGVKTTIGGQLNECLTLAIGIR